MSQSKKNEQPAASSTKDEKAEKNPAQPAEQKQSPATSVKKPSQESGRRSSNKLAWLLVLVLILIIGGAAWFIYRHVLPMHHQQLADIHAQQQAADTRIEQLSSQLTTLQSDVDGRVQDALQSAQQRVDENLSRQQRQVDDYQLAVQSVQAELANLDLSQESTWRIYEARNLVERAATKLWIEQDPDAALAFLTLAESHLKALDNPAHRSARQAIANDIARLEQLPAPQISAVSLKLGTLRDQISRSNWYQELTVTQEQPDPAAENTWWANLQRSANTLMQQFVRVQRRDTPVEPMIADAYFDVIQQRILLQLQLTQQAAMQGSQTLYEANIEEAIQFFAVLEGQVTDARVSAMVASLEQLKTVQLRPQYPTELSAMAPLERLANQVNQGG